MVKYSSKAHRRHRHDEAGEQGVRSFQTISQREGSATAAVTSRVRSI